MAYPGGHGGCKRVRLAKAALAVQAVVAPYALDNDGEGQPTWLDSVAA
jgi:hypothetical protein